MPIVHFLGRVLPPALSVSIGHDPTVNWATEDGMVYQIKNHIKDSVVDVEVNVNRYAPDDFVHIYKRAFDVARASVNLVAFIRGYGLTVILERFVDPGGNASVIHFIDPSLPPLCTACGLETDFDQVNLIVLGDWRIAHALDDLIKAITLPDVAVVNCARAIEGLKHLLGTDAMSDKQKWQNLRTLLCLSQDYLTLITDNSTDNRHGNRKHITGEITAEVLKRSWVVMNRFFVYKKRSSGGLPEAEFPVL
jgi:hypothetical protein